MKYVFQLVAKGTDPMTGASKRTIRNCVAFTTLDAAENRVERFKQACIDQDKLDGEQEITVEIEEIEVIDDTPALQHVWVVMRGETNSGGSLVGVRINVADAVKLALEQPVADSGGTEWKQVYENRWECGCDYVEIEGTELK